jgi:hypothetical protein
MRMTMRMTRTLQLTGVAVLLLALGVTAPAHAQPRWVLVNGILQNPMQLAVLDRYACTAVPNGNYWLNYNTGIWGYAGDPRPMGHISDRCGRYSGSNRPSLSERGMLYSTQPWGRGR